MEIHILNGDALLDRFIAANIPGTFIIVREALIEGPVQAKTLTDFWELRAGYFSTDNKARYYEKVVSEFEKLKHVNKDAAIHLWFEDDLFCQVNMWFTIDHLYNLELSSKLYRVFPIIPEEDYRWSGFGNLNSSQLKDCYQKRIAFSSDDVLLAKNLWTSYSSKNLPALKNLSLIPSGCFHDLQQVVQAHLDRFPKSGETGRPEKILQQIINSGYTEFDDIFKKFYINEGGIYGFGDVQVKSILARMN